MKTIYLLASGDQQLVANQQSWTAQVAMEAKLTAAVECASWELQRAHPYDPQKQHGFIDSLKAGLAVLRTIPVEAPVIVAAAAWQRSHHLWPGLSKHRGPILTVADWRGQDRAVPGLLSLNACLTKVGVKYSTLWTESFVDEFFTTELHRWLDKEKIKHDASHVRAFDLKPKDAPADLGDAMRTGRDFARRLRQEQGVLGIFDEGCWGIDDTILPDVLLQQAGMFKERLSQGKLYEKMRTVNDDDAQVAYEWYRRRELCFEFGVDKSSGLTKPQVLIQCKMYIATVRLAAECGCMVVGSPYQPGLQKLTPTVDLVASTLNSVDRPPVFDETTGDELFVGEALTHFPEGDGCAGMDGLVTYWLWRKLGYSPENARYELRWGRDYQDEHMDAYVWVLQTSGAAPPAHFGGWDRVTNERQLPVHSRLGGETLKREGRPGWIVWSRIFVADERRLCCDTGIAEVVSLPVTGTEDRWQQTTPQWAIMHMVLQGVTRDQMLARHKSSHLQVAYAPDKDGARRGLFAKAAAMRELGMEVSICGNISGER